MQKLEDIDKQIHDLQKEKETIQALLLEFPDLEEVTERFQKKYLVSKTAMSKVNKFDLYPSCGCCNDAAVILSIFCERGDKRVYSYPHRIYVGSCWDYEFTFPPNWKDKLVKENIPEELQVQIGTAIKAYEIKAREEDLDYV